jgi:glycosyltransferase involved in cell wall biosynthesis
MYLGCPVLVCNTASLPEVCADAAFYYEPASAESLREALLRAVQDDSARAQAITRGREVAAHFTWEQCAEQTLAVYRECL